MMFYRCFRRLLFVAAAIAAIIYADAAAFDTVSADVA